MLNSVTPQREQFFFWVEDLKKKKGRRRRREYRTICNEKDNFGEDWLNVREETIAA